MTSLAIDFMTCKRCAMPCLMGRAASEVRWGVVRWGDASNVKMYTETWNWSTSTERERER